MPEEKPAVRWERFVHRDSDGPLIVGQAAHEAAGLAEVFLELERAEPRQFLDGFLLRGITETHGRAIWEADIGELITDRGFISATSVLHPEMVTALASLSDAVLLQIRPHIGVLAVNINDALPNSEFAHEMEVVIMHGTTMQIVRKQTIDGLRVVDVTIVHQPPRE